MTGTAEVAVVTGASRGIGAATVRQLAAQATAEQPIHLVVNYATNRTAADSVVDELKATGSHVTAAPVQADVSSPEDVNRLFAHGDEIGPLTKLVNNAAVLFPIGRFVDIDPQRLERSWAVNITGCFLCAQEGVKRMSVEAGGQGGSIVNVSSRAASFGSPNEFIDYAATKGAVDSLTKGLATEVAGDGIRVNAVRPGLIDTDLHDSAGYPNRVRDLGGKTPIGRGGTADEVANLITWLLSTEASYVTGALLDIGGGR